MAIIKKTAPKPVEDVKPTANITYTEGKTYDLDKIEEAVNTEYTSSGLRVWRYNPDSIHKHLRTHIPQIEQDGKWIQDPAYQIGYMYIAVLDKTL